MLEGSLCTECLSMQYYDQPTQQCKTCHESCRSCSGPGQYSCVTCAFPLHLDRLNNQCVPCCTTDATPEDQSCCHCDKDTGWYNTNAVSPCLVSLPFAPVCCLNWSQKIKRFMIICCYNFFLFPFLLLFFSSFGARGKCILCEIHCFYLPLTHPRRTLTVPLKWKFIVVFKGFKSLGLARGEMLCCDISLRFPPLALCPPNLRQSFGMCMLLTFDANKLLCFVQLCTGERASERAGAVCQPRRGGWVMKGK